MRQGRARSGGAATTVVVLCVALLAASGACQQPWGPLDSISGEILSAVRQAGDEDMLAAAPGLAATVEELMFGDAAFYFDLDDYLPHAEPVVVPISVEVILVQDRTIARPSYSYINPRRLEELLDAATDRRPAQVVRAHAEWYDDADEQHVAECGGAEHVAKKLSGLGSATRRTGPTLVHQEVHFSVTEAPTLVPELIASLRVGEASGDQLIPFELADDVVANHFERKRRLLHSYAFYVLNVDLGQESGQFQYQYAGDRDQCGTSAQVGKERYAWLDLRATAPSMGNRVTGTGLASSGTVPSVLDYPPFRSGTVAQLEVQVAGFLARSVEALLTPALDHLPGLLPAAGPVPRLVVRLIAVHDHPLGAAHVEQQLRWWEEDVERVLGQIGGVGGQEVAFEKEHIVLADSLPAAAIVANSMRVQMSSFLDEEGRLSSHTYLDTRELRHWISRYRRALLREEEGAIVVPVYLFHMDDPRMTLLDRAALSVAYPELAVALSLPASSVMSDTNCRGQAIFVDPRKPARAVLAAALQAVWGVLPPTSLWSRAHQELLEDSSWAGGRNPFGVVSGSTELSFAQVDAAHRNQLVNLVNSTMTTVLASYQKAKAYYDDEDIILALDSQGTFGDMATRWGLFQWKLQHAAQSMALQDWDECFALVRSAHHDALEMVSILDDAADSIRSYLVCERVEVQPFSRLLNVLAPLSSFLLLVFVGAWICRAALTGKSKPKAKTR